MFQSKNTEKITSKLDNNAKNSFENVLLNQLNKNHYDKQKQQPPSILLQQKSMDAVHQPNYLSKLLSLQPQSFRSNENIQTNQENVRDKSNILKQSEKLSHISSNPSEAVFSYPQPNVRCDISINPINQFLKDNRNIFTNPMNENSNLNKNSNTDNNIYEYYNYDDKYGDYEYDY